MSRSRSRIGHLVVVAMLASIVPFGAAPAVAATTDVIINEFDADNVSTDGAEFIELYDGGTGATSLTGLALVFYNGSNDLSYQSFDLDGHSTDSDGYFVLCGNAANVPNCDLDVIPDADLIQNGQDAVALFLGDASSFPNGTPVTTSGLQDAVVYDTADPDDPGLLALLNGGQPQVDENSGGNGTINSNQRCPNGSGGARNTASYAQFAPTAGAVNACAVAPVARLIHEVQGSGTSSPLAGTSVIVEGVVVGDFQGPSSLNGFFLQEEDGHADADPATSEGVFVFDSGSGVAVSAGDVVRVTGTVVEFNSLTEISAVTAVVVVPPADQTTPASVTPSQVSLPVASLDDHEKFEGMAVEIGQDLYISEFFNFDRFGEIVLTTERQYQPTALFEPGSAAASDLAAANILGRITLDDGRSTQNADPAIHPNGATFDLGNLFRGGDLVSGVTGVMDFAFGLYRIQPTQGADYTPANPRPSLPDVGGRLQVVGFNVLNYFTTIDTGNSICGPLADQECRGADNAEEFTRQRDKIVAALAEIDADVVGAIEIENHPTDAAIADLVAGLNDATSPGKYAYVATGAIGPDAIRVAFIYQPASVTPLGTHAVLDSDEFMDPNNLGGAQNRPALAQTFEENATGEVFTVAVNHLKSKGSECGTGDDDPVQGNCNLTRTLGSRVLADWLASDPTGSGDEDVLIIGDLNSYDKEDPIDSLVAGSDDTTGTADDFTDLLLSFEGELAYSYLFDGQLGYLDYAMANQPLTDQMTGAASWHINADEPDILDYDTQFKQPAQDALYEANAYRSSDHDAVLVGIDLDQTAPEVQARFRRIVSLPKLGIFEVDYSCEDNIDPEPACVGDINGIPVGDGQLVVLVKAPGRPSHHRIGSVLYIKAPSFTLTVTGTDDAGNQATATAAPSF